MLYRCQYEILLGLRTVSFQLRYVDLFSCFVGHWSCDGWHRRNPRRTWRELFKSKCLHKVLPYCQKQRGNYFVLIIGWFCSFYKKKKEEKYCCFNSMIILEELDCYERKFVKEYNYQCLNNFLIFFSTVFIILITNVIFTFTT